MQETQEALKTISQKKKTINGVKRLNTIFIITMLTYPVLHFCIFWIYVNFNSILMAFQLPSGEFSMVNFKQLFEEFSLGMENSTLLISIKNTILHFSVNILILPFHTLIAYFFYRKIKGYQVFQIIFYLPAIVSGVAISSMFSNFIRPSGPLGQVLTSLGVKTIPEFLSNSSYANWTIIFYTLWLGWGGRMLLLGGAMARLPVEILESGRIDGVNTWQEIIHMIFPLIWPTLSTLLILALTGFFSSGGTVIMLFTAGEYKTSTLYYWIFAKVKYAGAAAYNQVAATGLFFTIVFLPIILGVRKLIEKVPVADY